MRKYGASLLATALLLGASAVQAATDITEVTTEVSGYKDAAIVVGVAILLFVIGRRVVRKLI